MKYIIGSRGSKLALVQTNYVCERLRKAYPEDQFEIEVITTKGDLIQDRPLSQLNDKGLFVREIEEKILSGEVHLGVHSMKDMPPNPAEGLTFTKAWTREDPRDALILREKTSLTELPQGATIGTGSKRRSYQLLQLRPDLRMVTIRGNVDTRLKKMEEQRLDGIVLAAAGLHRLQMENRITSYFSYEEMIPAPAQGILALEVRSDHEELIRKLDALSDESIEEIAVAERAFLAEINGSCHEPIGAICEKTKDGLGLRAVYGNEDGSRMAYANVCGNDPLELAKQAADEIRRNMAGKVYLVGGGPGDEDLITVKGLRLLREADCVIYDRLSSPELLTETRNGCEKIYVGKENHHHIMPQDEINQLLVRKAMQYQKVVRLKGGDVYVFGRGGEEAAYLYEKNVPYEIVPGISSCIAGLAYAGIPITHRGVASGFHVVTAHNKEDKLAAIDYDAMARGKDTCVFLMGLEKVEEIANNLIRAGKSPDTMAAVISSATTKHQRTCVAPLSEIAAVVKQERLPSPAVIVVGDVVSMREKLNFFEQKPLFGKHILVPKIGKVKSHLAEILQEEGANVTQVMVGEIVLFSNEFTRDELGKVDYLVFTSKHGVDGFFENLRTSHLDLRCMPNVKIAVIGTQTAEHLQEYHVSADIIADDNGSKAFGEQLRNILHTKDRVWYPRAEKVSSDLANVLRNICHLREIIVYKNKEMEDESIIEKLAEPYDTICFTSASSVERVAKEFGGLLPRAWNEKGMVISIGPSCSRRIASCGITEYLQAEHTTFDSMKKLILEVHAKRQDEA